MKIVFEREYIDRLLARVDITEVMSRYGVNTKKGSGSSNYYVADFCCGKTDMDNGRIKKSTGTFKCMACESSGDAIHFLTEYQNKTFRDAVIELAAMVGMDLPTVNEEKIQKESRKDLALRLAAEFYHQQNNYDYFISRGISMEVLQKHKAGYAPGGRKLRTHLERAGFTKEELSEFRLINQKGLDKFFFRAIIPIVKNGKVIDLYGRAVDEKHNNVPHLYLFGDIPFLGGYDFIQPKQAVSIFESFIDQLVAETHGFAGVNPGGAHKFNAEHARLLLRKQVGMAIFVFDGDKAGREGAYQAGKLTDAEGIRTYISDLPEKEDPAHILFHEGILSYKAKLNVSDFAKVKMRYELDQYSLDELKEYLADRIEKENEKKGSLLKREA